MIARKVPIEEFVFHRLLHPILPLLPSSSGLLWSNRQIFSYLRMVSLLFSPLGGGKFTLYLPQLLYKKV